MPHVDSLPQPSLIIISRRFWLIIIFRLIIVFFTRLIIVSILTRKAILLKNHIVDDMNNSVLRSGIRTNNFRHVTFATSIHITLLVNCSRFFTIFRLGIITLWWTLTK